VLIAFNGLPFTNTGVRALENVIAAKTSTPKSMLATNGKAPVSANFCTSSSVSNLQSGTRVVDDFQDESSCVAGVAGAWLRQ